MSGPVKYIAMKLGFVDGNMVQPGASFFWSGRAPKWAKPASEKPVVPEAKPLGGDTKPADTQAAVRRKAKGVSDLL